MARLPRSGGGLRVRSLNQMIPNMLTLLALCAGLSSVRFALTERFDWAAAAIILAAALDNLDGRIARLLSSDTRFGVELDSLSDFVSFGVAPVLVIYLWADQVAWAVVTFYVVCASLRLARFNTQTETTSPPGSGKYFTGLSSPAAAGVVLLPLMIDIEFGTTLAQFPWVSSAFALFAAIMMISQIPTYSLKGIKVAPGMMPLVLLAMSSFTVMLVTQFWLTLIMLVMAYTASIPWAVRSRRHLGPIKNVNAKKAEGKKQREKKLRGGK